MEKAKYIIATILLGALGSAFWEVCLKKIFLAVIHIFMPYLLNCFNDSFYIRVSRSIDSPAFNSFSYITLLFALFLIIPPNNFFKIFHSIQEKKAERILQNVCQFACFFAIVYNFFIVSIASNTARDTINNIEIVAPYITDTEYKQMRSDFFQMDSKSDYQNLIKKLNSIAEEHCLKLK